MRTWVLGYILIITSDCFSKSFTSEYSVNDLGPDPSYEDPVHGGLRPKVAFKERSENVRINHIFNMDVILGNSDR